MTRGPVVLVADDDPAIRSNLALLLRSEGYQVREAADGDAAVAALADPAVAAALLDLKMPGRDGLAVLREHADRLDEVPVVVVTAYGGGAAAIEAMRLGAYDYLTKPFDLDEVLFTLRRALTQRALADQVRVLSAAPADEPDPGEELVGRSAAMLAVFKAVGRVAGVDEPVLVLGESGTGKELVATAVHRNSPRAGGPFVKVNCAALSPALLESELFGHEKGAFTGAVARRRGRFEQAQGGTIFLDEVGELGLDLQAKLLRVLQNRTFERVGGEETFASDARVVAATNRDLKAMAAAGEFREDLYYRLDVVSVRLPPLRDRRDDIPLLADHLVRQLAARHGWPGLALTPDAAAELGRRDWPGNVRELRNVLTRAAVAARGRVIRAADLGTVDAPDAPAHDPAATQPGAAALDLRAAVADTERRVIRQALEQARWNRTQAARLLGISRRQLFEKTRLYDLREPPG
ncbi:sigma-54-dependent Fis family transcriptional regulator [bacterium]|nr:sigma-54-dependent Fis family transcriptional regulator [bacterium]